MEVFHSLEQASAKLTKSAVAIGNFDGVHLGHRALLKEMADAARGENLTPTVLTFFPHPVEVLNPGKKLERLTTASEKLALLDSAGVAIVLVEKFDHALAALAPPLFFDKYLVRGLKAARVHVGFNFMFGKGRQGNTDVLTELCARNGVGLRIEPPFQRNGVKVDSSTIRQLIRDGKVDAAAELLGRAYSISGQVAHGDHRGSALGFPTANVSFPDEKVLPGNGVYVTRARWQRQVFRSVTNVGVRPTFQAGAAPPPPRIETHLLDFAARLYDELLEVEFVERIREERKFPSLDALKAQIDADVAVARSSKKF